MRKLLVLFLAFGFTAATAWAQDAPSKKMESTPGARGPQMTPHGPPPPQRPATFGTTQISYYRIPASEFTPLSLNVDGPWADYWYDQPADIFARYSTVSNGYYIASPHLPSGATIQFFELEGCNTSAASSLSAALYDCSYTGDCSATTPISVNIAPGAGCAFSNDSSMVFEVDNYNKMQIVRVSTGAGDNTTRFSGVIIGYYLNVSAAVSQTFTDVPPSDPAYQFIEALAASGITSGCGGGNYCPDATLTRRQMAVFLAKALGLQFN